MAGFSDLLDRLRGLSGVTAVGVDLQPSAAAPARRTRVLIHIDGDPIDPAHTSNSRQRVVSPGFFAAMGITLLSGRDFTADDRQSPTPVVIVNRTFVRRYLQGKDPLTSRFTSGYPEIDPKTELTIVGVVDDVRQRSLSEAPEPAYYNSTGQGTPAPSDDGRSHVAARTRRRCGRRSGTNCARSIRRWPWTSTRCPRWWHRLSAGSSSAMTLMLWFGAAAVALAAVGIYGVIAFGASQRRGEVATRLALGAARSSVFWLIVKQCRTLTAVGAAIGVAVAYLSGRIVASRLYEVQASDPVILSGATALVIVIALLATVIPAVRSARLHPSAVLRPE